MDENPVTPSLPRGLWWLMGGHFLLLVALSFTRLLTWKGSFDLAIFTQAFWSIGRHGAPIVTSALPYTPVNWFGWHFSPVFYLAWPLYALLPSPFTLQLIQCACLSSAALPLALAFRRLALTPGQMLALLAMFLFNPYYLSAGIWDFHEAAFGALWMAGAYAALLAYRKGWFLTCLLGLLATKEHFGLSVAGFGLLWAWRHREPRFGVSVAVAGLLALVLVLGVVMPWLAGGAPHPMLQAHPADASLMRYHWLHEDHVLTRAFHLLFLPEFGVCGLCFLACWLLSAAGLPCLAPIWLLPALGDLAAMLLSLNPMPRSPASYHAVTTIAPLLIAAGAGLVTYQRLSQRLVRPVWLLALFAAMTLWLGAFLPGAFAIYHLKESAAFMHPAIIRRIRAVTGDAPLSVQSNLGFLFADRPALYPFPDGLEKSRFVVAYQRHPYAAPDYDPFNSLYRLSPPDHQATIAALAADSTHWRVALHAQEWLVLERVAGLLQ